MSSIKLESNASGTGIFTIASPNSNTNRTLTLPDATGTINTSGAVNEVPVGTVSAPSIYFSGDTNTGIFSPAADTIAFTEGGVESMRITSDGELLIGTTTAASTQGANLQVITAAAIRRNIAGGGGGALRFEKSRSATDGGYTIVQDGDTLGEVQFYGADGVDYAISSSIRAIVNGTPGSNDMPGALLFGTTADGSATSTERMRITSAGEVLVGGTTSIRAGMGTLTIERTGGLSPDFAQLNLYKNDTIVGSGSIFGEIGFYGNDTTSNTPTQHAYIQAVAVGTHDAGDNPTDLVFGTTPNNTSTVTERMRITSEGNLQFNSGYGSVATAYGCRAWVNFNGAANTNLSGTYSQSGTTVTVTATAHGLISGNVVYSDITSGTGVDGTYTVATVTDANTFTYTAGTSLTTSGNVTLRRSTIRASANVSSVADNSTGDYTINFSVAMPDENYSLTGACGAQSVSTGAGNYSLGIPGISSFFTVNGVKIQTWSTSNTQTDCFFINVAIFR